MGIEPTRSAWKAEVLPLNYIRIFATVDIIAQLPLLCQLINLKNLKLTEACCPRCGKCPDRLY